MIGFSDGVLSKYATPSLSTVSQHGIELGKMAAQLLIERIESKEMELPYRTEVVATELILREST